MKVLCINKEPWKRDNLCKDSLKPEYLGVYLVVEALHTNGYEKEDGYVAAGIWYRLAGFENYYHSSFFIQLPEPSADEMAEAEKESIINIETAIV